MIKAYANAISLDTKSMFCGRPIRATSGLDRSAEGNDNITAG